MFLPRHAHGLPGRLGFAPTPGRWRLNSRLEPVRQLEADLTCLRDRCRAQVLVTLLEEDEMRALDLVGLLEGTRRAGLENLWFPIRDGTAPPDLPTAGRLIERILEHLSGGRTVVVHCHAGIGRSGTVTACCLIGAGQDPARALELVREWHPEAATAPGQEKFVQEFARAHRAR